MQMTIALDYDGCYTADPELWQKFVLDARDKGHRVIVVTCRMDTPENRSEVFVPGVKPSLHYFTSMRSKRWYMEKFQIRPDIWIDDMPDCVENGR